MKKSRFTEEQIIAGLKEADAGIKVQDLRTISRVTPHQRFTGGGTKPNVLLQNDPALKLS